ncbi:MAG: YfiR family protein [Steroidobacteraceae bacterium]
MSVQPGAPRFRGSGVRLALLIGALCLACSSGREVRAATQYSPDAIKAAYLYRFAGYVKWPQPRSVSAPFTIDVIGDESVADELKRLLPDHPINGHPARVRLIKRIADLGDAQMLYVGDEFRGDIRYAIESVARRPVLVVTDEGDGLEDGGTINFVEAGEHVRFEVSLTAAARAGLEISSELLSVAARVESGHLHSQADCARSRITGQWSLACPQRVSALWVVPGAQR